MMFGNILAQAKMWGFWQYMFDLCNEDFSCVLGWLTSILLVFLAIVSGLIAMMSRLKNRRE
ncbi:MAG: hypothetical protein CAF45_016595 [Nitrospira sp. CG24E]|nr:MAG: hypothetical protein CAF45_016595 [Nitrospira sp. CG24E]